MCAMFFLVKKVCKLTLQQRDRLKSFLDLSAFITRRFLRVDERLLENYFIFRNDMAFLLFLVFGIYTISDLGKNSKTVLRLQNLFVVQCSMCVCRVQDSN